MVSRYPPNPRGTENVFSDIRVLSIDIYCNDLGLEFVYLYPHNYDKGGVDF